MRWTVVLLGLAGCDLAFPLDPVPDATMTSPPDPPGTLVCDKPAPPTQPVRANSTDYVPTLARDWAVSLELGAQVVQGDDTDAPQPIPFPGAILSPRLAADGLSMIVLEKSAVTPDVASFRRYVSDAMHTWNTVLFETNTFGGVRDFPFTTRVSAGTVEDNRVILDQSSNVFVEYIPSAIAPPLNERVWTMRATYQLATFELDAATTIREPALSPDGLFLAFVAVRDGNERIAIVHRQSIDQFFGTASIFYKPASKAKTPYVTNGCSRLFYTDETGGVVVVEYDPAAP